MCAHVCEGEKETACCNSGYILFSLLIDELHLTNTDNLSIVILVLI